MEILNIGIKNDRLKDKVEIELLQLWVDPNLTPNLINQSTGADSRRKSLCQE